MTAVFTRSEVSIAARSPAPPAPTITASYVWKVVIRSDRPRPLARVEREHDDRAEDEQREPDHEEGHVDREPDARPPDVVLHDDAQPVDPVDQREDQERPVPGPPEGALPPRGDEAEVHALHPLVEHVHDQDVPDREHEQHQPADPHVQPRPELETADGPLAPPWAAGPVARGRRGVFGSLDGHQKTPADSRIVLPMMIVIGIMLSTKMSVEASAIPFMWRALDGQKSKIMIFTPLMAWYSTAATSPSSSSWTTQLWYTPTTRL